MAKRNAKGETSSAESGDQKEMWIVPSRGRPHLAERLFNAGLKERGVLVLDEDDAARYVAVRLPFAWKKLVLPRLFLGPKINAAFDHNPREPWYGILNDDHVPFSHNWERPIIDAADSKSMAWPDDNYGHRSSSPVIGGDLVRELGWVVCPHLLHYYIDDAHERIAEVVGGTYLSHITVSHEHANAGRAPMDRTYRERPSPAADKHAYEEWLEWDWPEIRDRLIAKGFAHRMVKAA
jgi:hypothetical protein